jgi:hypothetical protein
VTQPENTNSWDADVARVSREMTSRLRALGVDIYESDSPNDVVELLEAVEAFERAVEEHGGDLMVDEPPMSGSAAPDDPHFLLPMRAADESVSRYVARLGAATAAARSHRPHP